MFRVAFRIIETSIAGNPTTGKSTTGNSAVENSSESLPQQALGSVPFHRVADFFTGNHGPSHVIGWQQVNYEKAPDSFGTEFVDLVKFMFFR